MASMAMALVTALAATVAHAAEDAVPAGRAVYERHCVACHQAGGKGMAGLAPALAGTLEAAVNSVDGRRYVAQVLIHGLSGRIVSQGKVMALAMPAQAASSDADLADVANHLARDLNGAAASAFTVADFVQARATRPTHKDLRDLRERVLSRTEGPAAPASRAQTQYVHHCSGCHLADGSGAPGKGIPSMRGLLGQFLKVPGGREFIVQVPGVMNSPLGDGDIAGLMNWLLPYVAAATLPRDTPPYTADEIAALRRSRPADVPATRQRLVAAMQAAGLAVEPPSSER